MTVQSTDESDDDLAASRLVMNCAAFMSQALIPVLKKKHGGSVPGKKANRTDFRLCVASQIDKNYFCRDTPKQLFFSAAEFERRFRMPRDLYEEIREAVMDQDEFKS